MSIDRLCIIGAGGHAKVVLDALRKKNASLAVDIYDADPAKIGLCIDQVTVSAMPEPGALRNRPFHVAIGANQTRARLHEQLVREGAQPMTICHPTAVVAAGAVLEDGAFIAAHAIIGPDARIGAGVIVNHGAVVDHDCVVGDFSHIAPNATMGGGVAIGTTVLVGSGATILPAIQVGDDAVIAAGATVVRNVAARETVIFALIRKDRDV